MKYSKEQLRPFFVPIFSILMGILILVTQATKIASQDFIINKNESYFAGVLLILIGIYLLFIRLKKAR